MVVMMPLEATLRIRPFPESINKRLPLQIQRQVSGVANQGIDGGSAVATKALLTRADNGGNSLGRQLV